MIIAYSRASASAPTATVAANSTVSTVSGATSVNVTVPGSANVGDLLIALLMHRSALTSTPSGWSSVCTISCTNGGITEYATIYSKTAVSGDIGASTTWQQTSSDRMAAQICACRRSDNANPSVIASATTHQDSQSQNPWTMALPSATATANGQLGLAIANYVLDLGGSSSNVSAGWTMLSANDGSRTVTGSKALSNGSATSGTFGTNTNSTSSNGYAAASVVVG